MEANSAQWATSRIRLLVLHLGRSVALKDRRVDRRLPGVKEDALPIRADDETDEGRGLRRVLGHTSDGDGVEDDLAHVNVGGEADDFNIVARGDGCRVVDHSGIDAA